MTSLIDYSITTIERPKNYIHRLLRLINTRNPIRLIVGGPKSGYLRRYRDNPLIEVIEVSQEKDWKHFRKCIHHRSIWNYWRGVTLCRERTDRKGLLLLEDDILPAVGWEQRFQETVAAIESAIGRNYCLALYTPHHLPPTDKAGTYAPYPLKTFFGTQGMYYPEHVRAGFAEFLWHYGVEENAAPYDILLKGYLQETNIPLFTTFPSLFEHVGKRSSGLAQFHHRASYFQKYLYPGTNPLKHLDILCRRASATGRRVWRHSIRGFPK